MSKARSIIMSVVIEGRTQSDTARLYEVSPSWVSKLVARYLLEGDTAFEPRSRRPHTSPGALDTATVALIVDLRKTLTDKGLDSGPDTIRWHLEQHHGTVVSPASIWRHLNKAGLVPGYAKPRPCSVNTVLRSQCLEA